MLDYAKAHIVLATDSLDPSGMGEHMLALGRALSDRFKMTLALPGLSRGRPMMARAKQYGMAVKVLDHDFSTWLSRAGVDLLHVHAGIGWEGHDLARSALALGLPVIRTEHLPYVLTDDEQKERYFEGIANIDQIVVVSKASEQSYCENGIAGLKLTTVFNGVYPLETTRPPKSIMEDLELEGARVLLTTARFTQQKNHAILMEALPAIVRNHPDVLLLAAGEGPQLDTIRSLADNLGVSKHVRFLGQRSDIGNLMSIAEIFVLPSLFEGLPLVVLEAMAAGVPVVASKVGGNYDALGEDHPFYFCPTDAVGLGEMVCLALSHPDLGETTAKAARRRYRAQFSAERMAAETASIYLRHLTQGSPIRRKTIMETVRIGFIGAGGIARRHLDIIAGFDDVQLVGLADPDLERANSAASVFGMRGFPDALAMLAECEIDAAFVCVPPFAHGDIERELAERRIPFFVEKPLSLDIETAEEVACLVEDLVTAVGYHWRYLDTVEEARDLLIGNPPQLVAGYWLDQTPPPRWWWKQAAAGGQIVEQATHIIDLARYLVGDITEVSGLSNHLERADFPGLDVATASVSSLRFATGAVGTISSTCLLRWGHRIGLHLFADGLAIELSERDIMVDVGAGRPSRTAGGDPVLLQDRHFIDAVKGRPNNIRCRYRDALQTHRVALAISDSMRTCQTVTI
ncbi:Predicted dehydrogenase [Phyllobacterium sp. YR620]|uniref:glycosyltransferase n=1 Tax=Phyllobacterium sp. YR620 TaxID=1881066 RepID=UPI00088F05D2|nr:Predicted dehydrogenase [Phyllobacterium sp. YR620]